MQMEETSGKLIYAVNLSEISFEDFIKIERMAARKAHASDWKLFEMHESFFLGDITISLN